MIVELVLPSGINEPNPSDKRLRELISTRDIGVWNCGSGEAGLLVYDGAKMTILGIVRKDPLGFHLHCGVVDGAETFVAVSSTNFTEQTEICLGGKSCRIPTAFFLPEETALKIVLHFARNGTVLEEVKWVLVNKP